MISIKFRNPDKSQVLIFDNVGAELIEKSVLGDIDHAILHTRYERFYVTPQILFYMFMNLGYIQITFRKGVPLLEVLKKCLRSVLGSLYRIYLLSCIQYIGPKVVITFIDNDYGFQFISRRYKGGYCLAIQNGIRCPGDLRDWLPPRPEPASIISMPFLFSLGNHDRDLYQKYGHQVDEFYPVGSLIAGYYKSQMSVKDQKKEFDLCLVSQQLNKKTMAGNPPSVGIGVKNLDEYLKRYLEETKLTLCVALRSNDPEEREIFVRQYGKRAHLVDFDRKNRSSYRAVDKSSVVIAFDSTLATESFGWGAMVLFCNLSGYEEHNFPYPGFWSITEMNYELFKSRLDYIVSLSEEEYRELTKAVASHIVNYDPQKPPQVKIREFILERLAVNTKEEKGI